MKRIFWLILFPFFVSCDGIDVRRAYDFTFSTWHLPETVRVGEAVEMRFTIIRTSFYEDTEYYVGYVQTEGKGRVSDLNGNTLINRELHNLNGIANLDAYDPHKLVFTLFYISTESGKNNIKFRLVDNFGQEKEVEISFKASIE